MNIFKNDKQFPKRYYARHIKEGLVHYKENGEDHLYLLTNDALKKMNATFEGRPIYIRHVDKENLETLREDSVGRVVKSFYNEFDGAWWVEIIADDEAIGYIEKGWAVSNAYLPTEFGSSGVYHDISYYKEIKNGRYGHLAIVDNPRYEEAVIMTPEEFKSYNDGRKAELEQLKNSKENEMLSKEEMDALVDSLKNSLTETIESAVKNAVEEKMAEEKKNAEEKDHREIIREIAAISAKAESDFEGGMEEKVRTIIGLAEKLGYSKDEAGKNSKDEEEDKKEDSCKNESDEEKEEEKEEKEEEKKENSTDFFSALKNAKSSVEQKVVQTMASGLKLGKDRYGKK